MSQSRRIAFPITERRIEEKQTMTKQTPRMKLPRHERRTAMEETRNINKYYGKVPVSIPRKSIAGRYRPVRVADGPITTRCRFIKNANWGMTKILLYLHYLFYTTTPYRLWEFLRENSNPPDPR